MPSEQDMPMRDYEEALRSLGRLFDEQRVEDILVMERRAGFLVTGLRGTPGLAEEPGQRYEYIERDNPDDAVVAASMAGAGQRGTAHRADRNEEGLRLIGRYVNERDGSRVLLVDQGDGFALRMLMDADDDMPHRFDTITSGELESMRAQAIAFRRAGHTAAG
jgi:hypothetical protein